AHLTKLGVWRYAGTQRPTPKSRTRTTPRDQGRDPARRSPNGDRWLFWLLTALGLAGDKLSRAALQVRLPPLLQAQQPVLLNRDSRICALGVVDANRSRTPRMDSDCRIRRCREPSAGIARRNRSRSSCHPRGYYIA